MVEDGFKVALISFVEKNETFSIKSNKGKFLSYGADESLGGSVAISDTVDSFKPDVFIIVDQDNSVNSNEYTLLKREATRTNALFLSVGIPTPEAVDREDLIDGYIDVKQVHFEGRGIAFDYKTERTRRFDFFLYDPETLTKIEHPLAITKF